MKELLIGVFFFPLFANAQNSLKAVIKDNITKEKLPGATCYFKKLQVNGITDSNGVAVMSNIPNGKYELVVSMVGYEKNETELTFPITTAFIEILLQKENDNLDEVIVTSTRTNSRIKDIPVRVEVIGEDEVNEETNMRPANISMLLAESPGIQAQQTSAVNGNVSIRLQGLDGKYTQILKDGFPLYGGFGQGLSIMQIPPLDLRQVEIIKGSSGSLYGSDAIAGLVNLISKQPLEKGEATLLVNQTSVGGSDANAWFSKRWKRVGFTFLSANSFQKATDINKDGFSDLPKFNTYTVAPTLYYYFNPATTLRFGINATYDNRKGGDMQVLNGQPDATHKYFEENISNRVSTQLKFDKQLDENRSLTIKNSVSYFDRAINQSTGIFKGKQISSYTEAAFNYKAGNHQLVAGINFISEQFTEDSSKSHLKRDYNYTTAGVFLQDDWKLSDKATLQVGIRSDHQNKYGIFILPRLSFMYKFNKGVYLRVGSGLGYKLPGIFSTASEQQGINNIQPLAATIKAEKSVGGNLDINYKTKLGDESTLSVNQSFFITQITDPLVLDSIQFVNKSQPIVTTGFETNIRLKMDELQFFVGYVFADARRKYNTVQSLVPLTPKHKINCDIIYEKENDFSVALEAYYISSMFRDLDTNTKEYTTFGIIAQKHFKHFSLVANCENIFDIRQTNFENMVVPPLSNPSFRQVYAPLDGRVFNIAVRIKL